MAVYKRFKGKRLKPGDKDWDRGKWWVEFRLRSNDIHQSIPGARTKQQAERAESAIREAIYNGKYNKEANSKPFSEFVDQVFVPWARENKASWRNDESRAKELKAFFKNRPLRDITPALVRKLKSKLKAEKTMRIDGLTKERTLRKGSTVNRYLQLLSKIFEMAFDEELLDANPVRRVPLDPEGEGRERYLTYEEEGRLLAVLNGRLTHLHAPVVVAIDTGMRKITELLGLRIEHCNFGDNPVFFNINGRDIEVRPNHVLVEKTKNKKPRTLPMTWRVRTELLRVIQERAEAPIFCNARTGVNLKEIKKGFKKACEMAGIPYGQNTPGGLTFHDLRHTYSTRLAGKGADERTRMALLGQGSLKMVRRYSHATPEEMEEAVNRLPQGDGQVLEFKRKQA
jgi:integrase